MASGFERLVTRRSSPPTPPAASIPGLGGAYKFVYPKPKRKRKVAPRYEKPQNTPNLNRYPGFHGTNRKD
jgi:hypothetical protein